MNLMIKRNINISTKINKQNFETKSENPEIALEFRKLNFLSKITTPDSILNSYINNYQKSYSNKINIKFVPNNIFGTCSLILNSKVIKSISAGLYKFKSSRKMKKYIFNKFLNHFIKVIQENFIKKDESNKLYFDNTIITIIASKKFRRQIEKSFQIFQRNDGNKKKFLYIIRPKKCFNGCRVSKKRRKKRIRFRVFK